MNINEIEGEKEKQRERKAERNRIFKNRLHVIKNKV